MPGCRNSARPPKMQFSCTRKNCVHSFVRRISTTSPRRPVGVHWDAVEYWQPRTGQGVVYVFHGSETGEGVHTFVLAGLGPDKHYLLHFEDGSAADRGASGRELMQSGLKVDLPAALSSELVFLTEIATKSPKQSR